MRIINYLKSDRSNRLLLIIIIVLINLVSLGWYARLDLTAGDTYSLSSVSRRTIASLREPLTVSIFFSPDLPAPYNGVSRYLKDLMGEYEAVGNPNFRYRFVDVEGEDGRDIAASYGIYDVQVQEVKSDQFQSRNVYMGIALSYGSAIEQLGEVTATDGLEYRLTTTISRMVGTVAAAASLEEKVEADLYYSPALAEFNIAGFSELERTVAEAVGAVNSGNNGIIELNIRTVNDTGEATALGEEYGFQRIAYTPAGGAAAEREATLGMVLRLGDRFQVLPIDLSRQIFGGYALAGLTDLEERLTGALEGLLNENPPVGYLTGHGEKALGDAQTGAAQFKSLNEDLYELREINLSQAEIPPGITTLVINGPKTRFSSDELYQIDQFLLRGGSLLLFLDPYQVIQPQQNPQAPAQPVYLPIASGLEPLLEKYGIEAQQNYLLDTNSYEAQAQFGPVKLYHIPILKKESLNQHHPITKNLGQVVLLSSRVVAPSEEIPEGVTTTVLAESSDQSWTMQDQIDLTPMSVTPPAADQQNSYPLLVLAEGSFESFYEGPLSAAESEGGLQGRRHISSSIRPGKILVAGTSEMTGPQLLDPEGRSPNAILVHNMLDYLNGNEEMPLMRSKGLNLMPLGETGPEYRTFVKGFSMAGIPLIILLIGLFVWRLRESRRRSIQALFSKPDRKREASK